LFTGLIPTCTKESIFCEDKDFDFVTAYDFAFENKTYYGQSIRDITPELNKLEYIGEYFSKLYG